MVASHVTTNIRSRLVLGYRSGVLLHYMDPKHLDSTSRVDNV